MVCDMEKWKSKKSTAKHDIWVSEIKLKTCNSARRKKVKKLLKLLKNDIFEEGEHEAIL